MIRKLIFVFLVSATTTVYGQVNSPGQGTPATIPAPVAAPGPPPAPLSEKMFKQVLNQQFSYVLNGTAKSQAGNFASVDLTKPAATFNASSSSDKGVVFTLNASAAVKYGLGSVFNNSKLNTDVSIEGKISFLQHVISKNQIVYDASAMNKYNADVINAGLLAKLKKDAAKSAKDLADKKISRINQELYKLNNDLAKKPNDPVIMEAISKKTDSLNLVKMAIQTAYGADQIAFDAQVDKEKKDNLKALADGFKIVAFDINWMSISYKASNTSFYLFDPVQPYASQVSKSNYVTHTAGIQFNHYSYDSKLTNQTWFFQVGVDAFIKDNMGDLKTLELNEKTEYGPSSGVRNSTKKYTVYVDSNATYKKDLRGLNLHMDFYYFLFKGNPLAIHLYPQASYAQKLKPEYDAGTGVFFSLKDSKDATGKAIVNAELYCNFLDVFNSKDKASKFVDRNDIGLRFTFPINFMKP